MKGVTQTLLHELFPAHNHIKHELFDVLHSDTAAFVYMRWATGIIDEFIESGYNAYRWDNIPDMLDEDYPLGRYCLLEIKEPDQVHYYSIGLALDNGIIKPLDAIPGKVHGGMATYRIDSEKFNQYAYKNIPIQVWNPGMAEWQDTNSKVIYMSAATICSCYSRIEYSNYLYITDESFDEALDETGNHPHHFAIQSFRNIGTKYKLDINVVPIEDESDKHPSHHVHVTVTEVDLDVSYKFIFKRYWNYVCGDLLTWTLVEAPDRSEVKIGPLFDLNERLTAIQKEILFQYATTNHFSEDDAASLLLVVHPSGEIKIAEI